MILCGQQTKTISKTIGLLRLDIPCAFTIPQRVQDAWKQMQPYALRAFEHLNRLFGTYIYPEYSIIQGGDGGMEYPMATLVTGQRSLKSLVGVVVHEMAHAWYHTALASNESLYAWLDEGFTTYAATRVSQLLWNPAVENVFLVDFSNLYTAYYKIVQAGAEERMNTLSDHFTTNKAYSVAAYVKGAIFQHQLSYIVGQQTLDKALLRYYAEWKYRHPSPQDYIRVVEKTADLQLAWYLEYFANTTKPNRLWH